MCSKCALFSDSMWTTASFTCEASCNDINSHFSLWWVEADTLQSWNIAQTISWSVSVSHKQGSALFVHALILFCDCPLVNSLSSECGSVPPFETSLQLHHWSLKLHMWSKISSYKTIAPKHLIWSLQWWKGKWQCNGRKSLAQVSKKKTEARKWQARETMELGWNPCNMLSVPEWKKEVRNILEISVCDFCHCGCGCIFHFEWVWRFAKATNHTDTQGRKNTHNVDVKLESWDEKKGLLQMKQPPKMRRSKHECVFRGAGF